MAPAGLLLHAEKVIQGYGYRHRIDLPSDTIRFRMASAAGSYYSELIVSERRKLIRHYVMLSRACRAEEEKARLRELVSRVNQVIVFGSLSGDYELGTAWYRGSLDAEGVGDAALAIERLLIDSVFALQLFTTAKRYMLSGAPPLQSLEAARLVLDA